MARLPLEKLKAQFGLQPVDVVPFESLSDADYYDGTGLLGLPVFQNLELPEIEFDGQVYGPITLLDVIVTPSLEKVIQQTAIAGRNGTVKEYIANGDYAVSIQGVLAEEQANLAPFEALRALNEYLALPVSIPVSTRIFETLGIFNLVVTGFNFPKPQGFVNVQPFEIQALSDLPIELELNLEA